MVGDLRIDSRDKALIVRARDSAACSAVSIR